MAQQCPLIFRQVDSTLSRINTLFIMSGIVLYLMSGILPILIVLVFDFLLRLYGYKHLSPLQRLSLNIQSRFALRSKMEDAGAKRLAAFFALGFIGVMVLAHLFDLKWIGEGAAVTYLVCAALDLVWGYCIACRIYYIAKKIYPQRFM